MLTDSGYSIGQIANHSDEKLSELVSEIKIYSDESSSSPAIESGQEDAEKLVDSALNAILGYNTIELEYLITDCSVKYGNIWTINNLLVPTIHRIGVYWREGRVKISHEHLASEILRTYLGNIISNSNPTATAPRIIVTTPPGQLHEFGAILAAATAATEGWNVCYLGPSLPSEEIASAVLAKDARVIALSIVFPGDDPNIINDIKRLREIVNDNVKIIIGGRAFKDYMKFLWDHEIIFIDSLDEFRDELEKIRHIN